jgi:hypothetical protein
MRLPEGVARHLETKLTGNPPQNPCLVITVWNDQEARDPMGMIGLELAAGRTREERE